MPYDRMPNEVLSQTHVNLSTVCEAQPLSKCPNAFGLSAKLFLAAKFVLFAQCAAVRARAAIQ